MVWMVVITLPSTHTVSTSPKHMLPVEVITTNNCVNRMTRLKVNAGKCAGGDSIRAGGRCGSGQSERLLLHHCNNLHQTSLPASVTLWTVLRWTPHYSYTYKTTRISPCQLPHMLYRTRCLHVLGMWSPFSSSSSNTLISYTRLRVPTSSLLAGLTPCDNVSWYR